MNPFDTYPIDFNVYSAMTTFSKVVDALIGDAPITVTTAAKDKIATIAQKSHVPVSVPTATTIDTDPNEHTTYTCEPLPADQQAKMLGQLQHQLAKMPAAALQKIDIRHITLCDQIEKKSPELNISTLDGATNWRDHTMYLSAVHVFHHELFHMMWGDPNGCSGTNVLSGCQESDEDWSKNDIKPWYQFWTVDPNEERANYAKDLFNLDTKEGQERYDARMQVPESRAKIEKVKSWLKTVDPRLNETFWNDLRSGKVNDTYWQNRK